MAKKILWLDNDPAYIIPYVAILREEGYEVTVTPTVTAADEKLAGDRYDLIILDVMVPTKTEEEELKYTPEETEHGYKMGLVFYIKNKQFLNDNNTKVLVLTVRLDKAIQEEFSKVGLMGDSFSTKYDLREVEVFLQKVESILGVAKVS